MDTRWIHHHVRERWIIDGNVFCRWVVSRRWEEGREGHGGGAGPRALPRVVWLTVLRQRLSKFCVLRCLNFRVSTWQ